MATVTIKREGGKVVYDPDPIKLGANDFVIWANEDPEAPHQPTKQGQPANYWMDFSLPKYDGQTAATSPAINLAGPNAISYVDGLNPTAAGGTITF